MPCNFRAFIRQLSIRSVGALELTLALTLTLCGAAAWAEKADRDRAMNIEADRLAHDELKKITLFQGRVVATKGTIVLRGHSLEIRQEADGSQFAVILPAAGERAFFRQKREGVMEFMEAEAERIDYDGRRERIALSGRAVLRRWRGNTLADEIQGQTIVYDNLSDQFSVDGAPRGAHGEPGQRVRAVLTPKPKEEAGR